MVDSSSYPRVLVVGQSFNRRCGGGVTLSNLFEGWPPDRLGAAAPAGQVMDWDVCGQQYVLGTDEAVWAWPLSLVRRRRTPPSGAAAQGSEDGPAQFRGSAPPAGRAATVLHVGLDLLGVREELLSLRMSAPLRAWIQGFAPDIVYSDPGNLPMMSLVDQISAEFSCPFALHIMDDWPSYRYRDGVLQGIVRSHMERRLRSLISRAASLLVVSDAMAAEYEARYGRTFLPVHNPVDLQRWDALAAAYGDEPDRPPNDCLRVVYAGKVNSDTSGSLLDVAEVISDMSSHGQRISLRVNTPDTGAPAVTRMAACRGVVVAPAGEYCRVPSLMKAADVLLLPLDFDERSVRSMRLSMSTKVSEYLASGRPVLTYAPRGSAVAEYARTGGWSLLVDERDPAAIRRALNLLMEDRALRREMGSRARQVAAESHDASRVRAQFRAALMTGATRVRARS
jgi:glycosyltransferase involved in cell wall biosynthesis